jgi:hypothetical protein
MQNLIFPGLVFLTVCAKAFSQEVPSPVPHLVVDRQAVSAEGALVNPLPDVNAFRDFEVRLKAAIEARDRSGLESLYQTNGVSAEQLKEEFNRWEPRLRLPKVSIRAPGCIFRDLDRANKMWKKLAERLTPHRATHIVQLPTNAGYWMLPLVEVDGRLLIVPSDKSRDMALRWEDAQPDGATNGSPRIHPETNSTPSAAGLGR